MTEEQGGRYQDRDRRNLSTEELLTQQINSNAQKDQGKIRIYLNGKVVFQINDTGKNYVFDWTADKLRTEAIKDIDSEPNVDCVISLGEQTLQKITSGDINPQIAMLSNKINIKGKVAFAVYVFNLLVN